MDKQKIQIGNRTIGAKQPSFLIAEIAQAHDGSLGFAHSFIDLASRAGADAIKFQVHIADAESTLDEEFRVPFSFEDANRFEYWKRMEFRKEQWAELKKHAEEVGLVFFASAFSLEAVALLENLEVEIWKISSGEIENEALAARILDTKKPVLISTGMSTLEMALTKSNEFTRHGVVTGLFQCTTQYPTPFENVGLNILDDMREEFSGPVGLSDHSGSEYPSIAAIARGANMIEVHLCMNKNQFGPDTSSSLDSEQFTRLKDARDCFHTMISNPVDKSLVAERAASTRILFAQSLAPKRALTKGHKMSAEDFSTKKPGTGLMASEIAKYIGRELARDVSPERLFRESDFISDGINE